MRQLHSAIHAGLVAACHDISDGGLAVALAEMAIAGRCGATIDLIVCQVPIKTHLWYCIAKAQVVLWLKLHLCINRHLKQRSTTSRGHVLARYLRPRTSPQPATVMYVCNSP